MRCSNCHKEYDEQKLLFCPRCGKASTKNEKNIKATKFFLYAMILILWVGIIAIIFVCTNEDYFFETNTNGNSEETIYTPIPEDDPETYTSLSRTSINYNNQYYKQNFKSITDVYDLIVKDSVSQKSNCPKEIVEIENEIVNNYEIKAANLCEMDVTFAKELKNVISFIYNTYPQARNYLTNITLANVGDTADYMAAFMPIFTFAQSNTKTGYPVGIKTQILLNARYFLNINKIENAVSYSKKVGYFPKNATRSSTVAHEFGHYLSYIALLNHYNQSRMNYVRTVDSGTLYKISEDFNDGNFSYTMITQAYRRYLVEYNNQITLNDFRGMISNYAIAKDSNGNYVYDETIAEAFHDCYLNGQNASIASQLIMNVLLSYL